MRRVLLPLAVAFPFAVGGWAVITVDDVPDHLVVGQPVTVGFYVRQHGQRLVPDLATSITVKSSGGTQTVRARAVAGDVGHYTATFTPTAAGLWTVSAN